MSNTAQSYVIEVGDDQVCVIIKEHGETEFQFHAALLAYQALEGRRFANPLLAERAAIAHSVGRRRTRRGHAAFDRRAA